MSEMKDYKSNSYKSKAEAEAQPDKKVEKIVSGNVKTKKKNKFADVFISEDAGNVTNYIFMDVLVPAIKKAVSDIVTNGIDMILYGGNGRPDRRSGTNHVNYNKMSERRDYSSGSVRTRPAYGFDDIVLDNRAEAEDVLNHMEDMIGRYGMVTVADLHDMVGVTGNYTDNRYGWTNIRSAQVVRVRDGFMLKLPRAVPID